MTPEESRSRYISSIFSMDELLYLTQLGLAQKYISGEIEIDEVYKQLKDTGI